MNYVTKELARQMESCIKQTHIEVTNNYPQGKILEIKGGAACFSGYDSYLSQVVGWGFATEPKQFLSEIESIEHFYYAQNHERIDIELCPFVGNDLTVFLSERGYCITELNNVSALNVQAFEFFDDLSDSFQIKEVEAKKVDEWAKQVALGFGYPEAQEQFSRYAQAKGVSAFAVYDRDVIIAGALISIQGAFCDLGVTSTLPAYRGKGLQKKLLHARLKFAKQRGVSWALVTTEPGTISDLNVQKVGFHCVYTRIKMTLE